VTSDALIDIRGLSLRLGGKPVLSGIDLAIRRGEIVTLVGPNGSGKTSLLRTVLGALSPDRGTVRRAPGLRIGYVPQKLRIDGTLPLTVDRFMALPSPAPAGRVAEALERAGAARLARHQIADLSGGELQRVLFARALLPDPDLLILDEATRGLDQPGSADFYRRIADWRETRGASVLMVSHELHVVMAASDRVICLNGHICCEGAPEHVAQAEEYRALFGTGTGGTLALYRHEHDHSHGPGHDHSHGAHSAGAGAERRRTEPAE